MIDGELIERICGYAQLAKGDTVLEIGAGTGGLTHALAEKASVVAVEKDQALAAELKKKFAGESKKAVKVRVIGGDALRIEFPRFDKCVSNIPYLISKKIVAKLLLHDFDIAVLTLQREFAEKLVLATGVVVSPGGGFGRYGRDFVRMALVEPKDRLEEAVQRIDQWGGIG